MTDESPKEIREANRQIREQTDDLDERQPDREDNPNEQIKHARDDEPQEDPEDSTFPATGVPGTKRPPKEKGTE